MEITPAPIAPLVPAVAQCVAPVEATREAKVAVVEEELDVPARDFRFYKHRRRPPTVIEHDIGLLEPALYARDKPNGIDVEVLSDLAYAYAELARVTPAGTTYHDQARANAVAAYTQLAGAVTSSPTAATAFYLMALESELSGLRAEAEAGYELVLRRYPESSMTPYVHFALGELLYERARFDASHAKSGLDRFERVLDDPTTPSALRPWALLRVGQLQLARGETKRGHETLQRLQHDFPDSEAARTSRAHD